jgi:peptide/nickel transport system permease protein
MEQGSRVFFNCVKHAFNATDGQQPLLIDNVINTSSPLVYSRRTQMGLGTYIVRRCILVIPTLLGVVLLIFAVTMMFTPTERASLYIHSAKELAEIPVIIKKYHLDAPIYDQFITWFTQLLHGNLGYSVTAAQPVLTAIEQKFPATLELVIWSLPITILGGIYLGTLSAVHRDKLPDHFTRTLAIIGYSLPTFWLGIILMAIFFADLGWFPPNRLSDAATTFVSVSGHWHTYTGLMTIDGLLNGQPWITLDALQHLVLPTATLVIINMALIMRVMRSSMLEALGKGYVMAARAKGLSNVQVINKHARRNALIPVMTVAGLLTAGLMTGVVITETVFNFNGLGRWAADAAGAGGTVPDIPAVLGFALLAGIIYVFANLIVDIMYAYIDPRIRLG